MASHLHKGPPIYRGKIKELWSDENRREELEKELRAEQVIREEDELTTLRRIKGWFQAVKEYGIGNSVRPFYIVQNLSKLPSRSRPTTGFS